MKLIFFPKKCRYLFLLVGFFFFGVRPVFADENFNVSLSSTYTVSENGNTSVQQKFTLVNKKATVFAKEYGLEVSTNKLRNVRVFDDHGDVPSNVTVGQNKTTITINFSDAIVGEGKGRSFTIEFDNPDTAVISGNVLEVDVPKLSNISDYSKYDVYLKVPDKFGQPARVTPNSYSLVDASPFLTLHFDNLANQSISALFGQKQIFDYTLRYNLENPTGNIGVIQVALPPDTPQQKMNYVSLDPLPKEMNRDSDGNWIATYEIASEKNLDVYLTGKATVFLEPQPDLVPESPPTPELTASTKYWEADDLQIKQLAQKYKTPREIYDYVVSHLTYDYAKVGGDTIDRLGALGALDAPTNAACQEFTDLFIAIARAAGIPARRLTGFAYTANSRLRPLSLVEDVLHAWPEYYDADKKTWVPIDPTWGNTTGGINYFDQFDFNHLVFAINGSSSTTPYAAGSYKRSSQNTKDVEVKFGEDVPPPQLQIDTEITKDFSLFWPLNQTYSATIANKTGVAWYDLPLEVATDNPQVFVEADRNKLDYLLPFQKRVIHLRTKTKNFWDSYPFTLTLSLSHISSSHELKSGLNPSDFTANPFTAVGLGGGVVFIAVIAGSLLVSRRKR